MARKTKPGIDYFSHDTDLRQDKNIKVLKAKYGIVSYAIYLGLLEEIYHENGYYIEVDDDFDLLFSDELGVDYTLYKSILNDCVEKGLFHQRLYEEYKILTSKRIQNNYCSATERRKEVSFIKEYLLVQPLEKYNKERINVYINSLNTYIGTQSKVKESKVKESKENIRGTSEESTSDSHDDFLKNQGGNLSEDEKKSAESETLELSEQTELSETTKQSTVVCLPVETVTMKYLEDCFEILCVNYLISAIIEINPNARVPCTLKEKQKWALHIDRLRRLDHKTDLEIKQVLAFATKDNFWKGNILSTSKFRDKYDTLFAQMVTKKTNAKSSSKDKLALYKEWAKE